MNCPRCGVPVADESKQCPACSAVIPSEADAGSDSATVAAPQGSTPRSSPVDSVGAVDFGPRYRVERLLGQGGMGAVYLAFDVELGRQVALKLVRPDLQTHPEWMARFRQELLLASKISHRNILRLHDLGDAGGIKFISMAYVDGEDLHQLLVREGKLPLDRMLNITRQICAALEAAHAEGVVHRDLKPQNIMLGEGDHVFVSDFGIAKSLGAVQSATQTGEMLGTPRYMAPEQVEAKSVDARTDIYALGLIFYEMLTGAVPFTAETTLQLLYKRAHEIPPAPKTVVAGVPDWLNDIIMKCLERDPANRYQTPGQILADIEAQQKPPALPEAGNKRRRYAWIAVASAAIVCFAVGGWLFFPRRAHALTEKDTILLADFANSTGDAVFDDTLKQALAVSLGQSPFLSIISDGRVRAVLQQMTRAPGERLTDDTAREVCQRAGSTAFISGSIAGLGSQYVIGLNAINCATGESLAREQVQAASKEKVLDALGKAATQLRTELGESLHSVQKSDVPLDQATTPSLEALKAFSLGRKKDVAASVPYYERAIELDPKFAAAYARLGIVYSNLGQPARASEFATKAFQLRDHASERDKLHIASSYYLLVTGELDKAIQSYTLWTQSYPRDWLPLLNLGVAYGSVGQYEKALAATLESKKLYPENVTAYENLVSFYLTLDRFEEAKSVSGEAVARKLDDIALHTNLYGLAFSQGDAGGMAKEAAWINGKPEYAPYFLALEGATEAYSGRLDKARDLTRRAVASTEQAQNKETASSWAASAALREALFGNFGLAREWAARASSLPPNPDAVLALAVAGDVARAQALTDEMSKGLAVNTLAQSVWLPTIRAQLAINRGNSTAAIDLLQAAAPYELGGSIGLSSSCMYPAYIRGQAYLAGGQGHEAAAEFQKILDHRGLVQNCATGALAHLGLARAYSLLKDTDKARAKYQDFLTHWKDADPGIPILKQAKAESAALK